MSSISSCAAAGGRHDELMPQLELLKKISDTLGRARARASCASACSRKSPSSRETLSDGKNPSEAALVKVAGVLLSVEDSLDDQLVRLILPGGGAMPARRRDAPDQDFEFRQVSEAVLRECIVNLARIKEAVSIAVQKPGGFFRRRASTTCRSCCAALRPACLMLGKGRAVELMDAIGTEVRRLIEPGAPALRTRCAWSASPTPSSASSTTWRRCRTGAPIPGTCSTTPRSASRRWPRMSSRGCRIWSSRPPTRPRPSSWIPKTTLALEERAKRAQAATHPLIAVVAEPAAVDPQFLELFIEEAKEEIASIQRSFPLWDQNPMDLEVARFPAPQLPYLEGQRPHGRRALDRRVRLGDREPAQSHHRQDALAHAGHDDPVAQRRRRAAAAGRAAGERPAKFRAGGRDHGARLRLCGRPRGRAAGRGPGAGGSRRRRASAVIARRAEPKPRTAHRPASRRPRRPRAPRLRRRSPSRRGGMDPQLHEIYSKETSSHLAEIREYLRKRTGQPAPHDLPESVYRAIHTLSGSSKMAEARHGIRITEPLNHFMRKVFDSGRGLSDAGLAPLADAVRAIENVVSHINETTAFFSEQPSLLGRLRKLEADLDLELAAEPANDTSASAIVPALTPSPAAAVAPPAPAAVPRARRRKRAGRGGIRSRDRQYL